MLLSARAPFFPLCLAVTLAAVASSLSLPFADRQPHKHALMHGGRMRGALSKRSHGDAGGFLKIGDAPPKLLEARQHGKMVLQCSANGSPAPTITWFKDGEPIFKEDSGLSSLLAESTEFPLTSLSETQSRIEMDCISEEDAGLYECVALTNTGKRASVATEVNVVSFENNGCVSRNALGGFESSSPKIYQWAGTYMQPIGGDARLVCRATGQHDTLWFGPDDRIVAAVAKGTEVGSADAAKYMIMDNGDLVIHDLSFEDMGMFKCMVRNGSGEDMQETFVYPHSPV